MASFRTKSKPQVNLSSDEDVHSPAPLVTRCLTRLNNQRYATKMAVSPCPVDQTVSDHQFDQFIDQSNNVKEVINFLKRQAEANGEMLAPTPASAKIEAQCIRTGSTYLTDTTEPLALLSHKEILDFWRASLQKYNEQAENSSSHRFPRAPCQPVWCCKAGQEDTAFTTGPQINGQAIEKKQSDDDFVAMIEKLYDESNADVRRRQVLDWENTGYVTYQEGEVLGSKRYHSNTHASRLSLFVRAYYPDGLPQQVTTYYKELLARRRTAAETGCSLDVTKFREAVQNLTNETLISEAKSSKASCGYPSNNIKTRASLNFASDYFAGNRKFYTDRSSMSQTDEKSFMANHFPNEKVDFCHMQISEENQPENDNDDEEDDDGDPDYGAITKRRLRKKTANKNSRRGGNKIK